MSDEPRLDMIARMALFEDQIEAIRREADCQGVTFNQMLRRILDEGIALAEIKAAGPTAPGEGEAEG